MRIRVHKLYNRIEAGALEDGIDYTLAVGCKLAAG